MGLSVRTKLDGAIVLVSVENSLPDYQAGGVGGLVFVHVPFAPFWLLRLGRLLLALSILA